MAANLMSSASRTGTQIFCDCAWSAFSPLPHDFTERWSKAPIGRNPGNAVPRSAIGGAKLLLGRGSDGFLCSLQRFDAGAKGL
jgi:hypothetical protein